MSSEFKTTFIPKRRLAQSEVKKAQISSRGNSFVSLIAILLFITALISSVGVYIYRARVEALVREKSESIRRAEKAFEPNVILELKKLDIRLKSGSELLDNHVALSDFFQSLGESTLPQVAFNDFSFDGTKGTEVQMTGEATGYLPIAQQSDLFEKNQYIQNPIFSDFALNKETGNVNFSLVFTLNPDLIKYGRTVKNTELKDAQVKRENAFIRERQGTVRSGQDIDFSSLSNPQG